MAVVLALACASNPSSTPGSRGDGIAKADSDFRAESAQRCGSPLRRRRVLARGRFMDRRWTLTAYEGEGHVDCLQDSWSRYGSSFPLEIDPAHPDLGLLNLAATTPPGVNSSVYVMEGYVSPRIDSLRLRTNGKTEAIEIIPRAERDRRLFVHLFDDRSFGANGALRLIAADALGRRISSREWSKDDFAAVATPVGS